MKKKNNIEEIIEKKKAKKEKNAAKSVENLVEKIAPKAKQPEKKKIGTVKIIPLGGVDGIGMNMTANKYKGIRAAQCGDTFSAKMTRQHNNANVLTLGGRVVGPELAKEIVREFLTNEFLGGRHAVRVEKMMSLEK